MIGYKLFNVRKDGSISSLFANKKRKLPINKWMQSEAHLTKGLAFRPFWHVMKEKYAPHLSMKGRAWYKVEIINFTKLKRSEKQGGLWFLAENMRILEKC